MYERKMQPQDLKCLCSKWNFSSLSMSLMDQGLQMDFLLLVERKASQEECFEERTWRFGKILVLASHGIEISLLQPLLYDGLFLSWLCRGQKSAIAAVSILKLSETTTCQNGKNSIYLFPLC
jgi:hypothetical protein